MSSRFPSAGPPEPDRRCTQGPRDSSMQVASILRAACVVVFLNPIAPSPAPSRVFLVSLIWLNDTGSPRKCRNLLQPGMVHKLFCQGRAAHVRPILPL